MVDTSGDSPGFILLDVVATAGKTAVTDHIPIARNVNFQAVQTMPFGRYHLQFGQDSDAEVVLTSAKEMVIDQIQN